ncbi:Fe-S cluster assembly scaffold SufA [Aurantimonas sp. C2-6-R+9]|uniref:Fe-S cluster assembly scaffold SufA n=2 Tax=root TaxID=1 RepID=A0A9C9NG08_9HYPH|nr:MULTISPECIES: Fe-S cluster assembly scaffold SufA [Aurantimonas]HDZ72934.1 Fe-S cluster assembly scaffold SufA [Aurantimonas coralicida]MEC5290778.1 Fe-S cluster assembly scaffold SufA [Aurantimonas sp. C2-3-R2]MEC5321774.1 Fe-S cluster assembly scaffold SufA [Aurantimonas sp. A3-2-R12]MEC5380879.1 Fe-S cluster assembly scaffold SufA [Aurantimonas sp. C2-6-R+9]MEC5411982.1 Fe-S cluster assembly scaffold SufA [Aurantimonas sp. C2-4-R8]
MGRFTVMSMTDTAADRVKAVLATKGEDALGLRVGIKKGGCAGMEYTVDLATEAKPGEDSIEKDGARVFIAPEAVLFLLGTEMDYEETVLRSGFTFRNPNQTSACGCGESVELKQADLAALAGHAG